MTSGSGCGYIAEPIFNYAHSGNPDDLTLPEISETDFRLGRLEKSLINSLKTRYGEEHLKLLSYTSGKNDLGFGVDSLITFPLLSRVAESKPGEVFLLAYKGHVYTIFHDGSEAVRIADGAYEVSWFHEDGETWQDSWKKVIQDIISSERTYLIWVE